MAVRRVTRAQQFRAAGPAEGRTIPEAVVIHALPVGGGILALAPLPGAGGDYSGDLEHISGWAPAMVISLVTPLELFEAGAQSLGQDIQDKGTRWVHLPVRDKSIPAAAEAEGWPAVSAQARQALLGGGRVLIHCKAGCGRSGMVALRLMIEAGEARDEALTRLRSVQPRAIETPGQLDWAMAAERQPTRFVRHSG